MRNFVEIKILSFSVAWLGELWRVCEGYAEGSKGKLGIFDSCFLLGSLSDFSHTATAVCSHGGFSLSWCHTPIWASTFHSSSFVNEPTTSKNFSFVFLWIFQLYSGSVDGNLAFETKASKIASFFLPFSVFWLENLLMEHMFFYDLV